MPEQQANPGAGQKSGSGRLLPITRISPPPRHLMECLRYDDDVQRFNRITMDPEVMGGKPCIRGMRVTVA
jgi:hypothetical protein